MATTVAKWQPAPKAQQPAPKARVRRTPPSRTQREEGRYRDQAELRQLAEDRLEDCLGRAIPHSLFRSR